MRLLATIVLTILLLGGTWLFVDFDSRVKPKASNVEYADALAETSIEIVRNFDLAGDADFGEEPLVVTLVSKVPVPNMNETLKADKLIEIPLDGVKEGKNSVTVFANVAPPDDFGDSGTTLNTMLVKVLYDNNEIARGVFASDDDFDSTLGGEVSFFIQASTDKGHAH